MENIISIIKSLSSGEIKLIRQFYSLKSVDENHKRGKLFEILLSENHLSDSDWAKAIGYSRPGASFQNLKQRLKSDMLCMLLMQDSKSKFCTPYAQATFDCRRNLLQGEILMSRGVYDEALEILNKAAKTACKFQLYAEQIQIEDLIRNHVALKGNLSSFRKINQSIALNYKQLGNLLEAKKKHYEVITPRLMGVRSLPEYMKKAKITLDELSVLEKTSSSSRISLYNNLSSINYYSSSHDFLNAEKHALELLDAVENDQIVLSKANLAGANMELANIYLNTSNYPKAVEYGTKAVALFKKGMINELHANIILFFAHFRNNNLNEASKILTIAQHHRLMNAHQHPQLSSRIHLLRAALSFRQGDIDHSSAILKRNSELWRNEDSWMPGYYMLDLLILIEKKSVELAAYKFEAFRKMLHRHGLGKPDMRISIIAKILKNLIAEGGDFFRIVPRSKNEIHLLSEAKEQYYWDPAGYEVIRFDEWFMKKVS
jgi:tetratricopeptide (TPR) repeat protein